jgi:hypothetical protein
MQSESKMSADLDNAKYVSFTSYKKDGTTVSLPVWVVPFEGGYAFTTDPGAFKVKRVRRDARTYSGTAVILEGEDGNRVARAIQKKYRIGYTLITLQSRLNRLRGKESHAAETAIKVMLSE